MTEEYRLPYSGSEITRRLREVDTKTSILSMTTAEYEALEEPNANILYMLTDAVEPNPTQVQIVTWESDD